MSAKTTYEAFVAEHWASRRGHEPNPLRDKFIMTVGLAGEVGEVCELLKKEVRDGVLDRGKLAMEIGDVFFYLTRIALNNGFSMEQVKEINQAKLLRRRECGKDAAAELEIANRVLTNTEPQQ